MEALVRDKGAAKHKPLPLLSMWVDMDCNAASSMQRTAYFYYRFVVSHWSCAGGHWPGLGQTGPEAAASPWINELCVQSRSPVVMLQSQTLDQTQGSLREKGQDAGAPDDGPVELTEELKAAIIKQVEFYCSDANLPSDKNLLKQFRKDANGWVPLKVFANFRKVRALTKDQQQLAESLRASKHIVISDDAKKVIALRRVVPVPQYDVVEIQRRTIVVESLPCSPTIEGVTAVFQRYGQVNLVRICTKESKGKLPEWLTSAAGAAGLHSSAGGAAVSDTPHAYVEFAREEDAIMAVAALHDTDGWRPLGIEVRHLVFPCSDASERTVPRSDNCAAAKQKQQTSLRRWNSTGGVVDSRSQPMTMGASTKPSPPTAAMRPTGPISHPQQQHRSFTLGGSAAPRCPPIDPPWR
ncbi:hypothetical protein QJQ45_028870 [Haematococcus lacustris]|nr:hypothetical protein QJQ45_028870 [Haematococcus lacustris]